MNSEIKNIETLKKEFDTVPSSGNLAFTKFYEGNIDSIETLILKKMRNIITPN